MNAQRHMARATVCFTLAVLSLLGSAGEAAAVGIWDPNDVDGRLDIRWVGVRYKASGKARLTVVLYPSFRRKALPSAKNRRANYLTIYLDDYMTGIFFRKAGRIRLSYGDHASNCCEVVKVDRPNRTTLVAVYHPIDENEPGFRAYGTSSFRLDGDMIKDRTRRFQIGPPPNQD